MSTYKPEHDFYAILGVRADAPVVEIKRVHKEKIALVHPDKHGNSAAAGEEARRLNEARDVLSDLGARRKYDDSRVAFLRTFFKQEVDRQADAFMRSPPPSPPRSNAPPPPSPPPSPSAVGLFHMMGQGMAKQSQASGKYDAAFLWEAGGLLADLFLGTVGPKYASAWATKPSTSSPPPPPPRSAARRARKTTRRKARPRF